MVHMNDNMKYGETRTFCEPVLWNLKAKPLDWNKEVEINNIPNFMQEFYSFARRDEGT